MKSIKVKYAVLHCWVLFSLVLLNSSCTYDHALEKTDLWASRFYVSDYFDIRRQGNERLLAETSFYIPFVMTWYGVEADVPHMETICAGVKNRFPQTYCGLRPENLNEAFVNASAQGSDYLIHAQVSGWDNKRYWHIANDGFHDSDAVQNLTGIDRVDIEMVIYHVYTKQIFEVIEMKSRSAALLGYRNQPSDLLFAAYRDLARSLSPEKAL